MVQSTWWWLPHVRGSSVRRGLQAYAEVSPDGADHFAQVIAKVAAAATQPFGLDAARLGTVAAATLVVVADNDMVSLPHTVQMYQALPDARLAIIPRASHLLLHEYPTELAHLIGEFLDEQPPSPSDDASA
jgi:pimeloyl-ACP methyl ester carboxylesterase